MLIKPPKKKKNLPNCEWGPMFVSFYTGILLEKQDHLNVLDISRKVTAPFCNESDNTDLKCKNDE